MAKKEIMSKGGGDFAPLVNLKSNPGLSFTGILKDGPREIDTAYGKGHVYSFKAQDGTAKFVKKNAKGTYDEVEVEEGAIVDLMATGSLHDKLLQVEHGNMVEVVFNGKKKNPKTGRYFNDFTVSLIEEE
jgi:hypothetical protein